jgi:saccharopepsin
LRLPIIIIIMKTATVMAAAALLGSASAAIHKMKLQKIPLEEQLVSLTVSLDILGGF